MKAGAAIAEILKREGVKFLIGYPVNTIIEASAQADIRTIIVRQERTGLHMADAVSRVTSADRIGVFCMQHGPGTENSFGGVAQAFGDSVPIVVMPGGYPRRIAGIPPNFNSTLNYKNVTTGSFPAPAISAESSYPCWRSSRNGRISTVLLKSPTTTTGKSPESSATRSSTARSRAISLRHSPIGCGQGPGRWVTRILGSIAPSLTCSRALISAMENPSTSETDEIGYLLHRPAPEAPSRG